MDEHVTSDSIHYFVDESGDPTIFGGRRRVMLGLDGISDYFMLGLLEITDIPQIETELYDLRQQLLNDPYFRDVPSFQLNQRKTAFAFHAKDDLPEVRYEVFKILSKHDDLRFFAVIKNKHAVLDYVLNRNQSDPEYHYTANELYDFCARRLLRDRFNQSDRYEITFAQRLNADRTNAMREQINAARQRFFSKFGKSKEATIRVYTSSPKYCIPLQAVDYYLWALQRLYIFHESRYLDTVAAHIRLIIDIDDVRTNRYGVYYSQKNPIKIEKLPH